MNNVSQEEFQRYVIEQLKQMRLEIADNTSLTLQTQEANQGVLDIFNTYTAALRVLKGIQSAAIWLAKIAVALAILWATFKFGIKQALESIGK